MSYNYAVELVSRNCDAPVFYYNSYYRSYSTLYGCGSGYDPVSRSCCVYGAAAAWWLIVIIIAASVICCVIVVLVICCIVKSANKSRHHQHVAHVAYNQPPHGIVTAVNYQPIPAQPLPD